MAVRMQPRESGQGLGYSPPKRMSIGGGGSAAIMLSLEIPDVVVVSCHSFSPGQRLLALSPGTEEIHILERRVRDYHPWQVLSKHTLRVTGLSWSASDRLVSVSEDRTAIIWDWDDKGLWKGLVVDMGAARGATCVSWAPEGDRFAAGLASSEAVLVSWNGKLGEWTPETKLPMKFFDGAVTALAWHPSADFLGLGTTGRRGLIFDVNPEHPDAFTKPLVNEDAASWVTAVAFSPLSGATFAFAAQDSTVRFKELPKGPDAPAQTVRWRGLPFLQLCFPLLDGTTLVACGYDCAPVLFRRGVRDEKWAVLGTVDAAVGPQASLATPNSAPTSAEAAAEAALRRGSFDGARDMFRGGAAGARRSLGGEASSCLHGNTITCCTALADNVFSTSSLDGLVAIWNMGMGS